MKRMGGAPAGQDPWRDWQNRLFAGGSARDMAYQVIREKIIDLEYKPGQALSDKQLTEELGVSRTPVREALLLLAAANMVVFKPQRGTFVAPIDTERMEMEQFSRCALEKEILSLAAPHMTRELAWQYEQNLNSMQHYLHSQDPDRPMRILQLDNEFHRIAFTAAGKEKLYAHMQRGMQHIERLRYLSLMTGDQENIYRDHASISRALTEGEPEQARALMERHLQRFNEDLAAIRRQFPEYFVIG